MPSFTCTGTSRQSTDACSLTLTSRHHLVAGDISDNVLKVKTAVPASVDVLHSSNITFTISGALAGRPLPSTTMQKSAITRHLLAYLETNANALDIAHISQLYTDEDEDLLKFNVASRHCVDPDYWPQHITLTRIDLRYAYRASKQDKGLSFDFDPFAPQVYLPLISVLDRLLKTFVVHHLVKRYPLIFGQWGHKVHREMSAFKPLARSILDIVDRSPNTQFQKKCRKIIRRLAGSHDRAVEQMHSTLSKYLASDNADDLLAQESASLDETEVLQVSLLRMLKLKVRPSRFKVALSPSDEPDGNESDCFGGGNLPEPLVDTVPSTDKCALMDEDDWDGPPKEELTATCLGDKTEGWLDPEDLPRGLDVLLDFGHQAEEDQTDHLEKDVIATMPGGGYSEELDEDLLETDAALILEDAFASWPGDETLGLWLD